MLTMTAYGTATLTRLNNEFDRECQTPHVLVRTADGAAYRQALVVCVEVY